MKRIPVYYHAGFAAPIGEGHMMPIRKFALVAAGLRNNPAAALGSGFHHAHADHGEGFCTFNGLVVAAEALWAAGAVAHVAVLDLDLHYGNGTASLAAGRPHRGLPSTTTSGLPRN